MDVASGLYFDVVASTFLALQKREFANVSAGASLSLDVIAIEGSGDAAALRHYPAAFDAKGKIL